MDARTLKQERDSARREVRTIATANRDRIGELKQLFSKATELKLQRDKENSLAKEFREKRDGKKGQIDGCKAKLSELRGNMQSAGGGKNPMAIQEQVEQLEWYQQTEALSPKEEREMSKKITELRKQLPHAKEFQQAIAEYSQERKKLSTLISEERALHEKMLEHAKKAQDSHDKLIQTSKKIEGAQKSISATLEVLKEKEDVASEKHGELVKAVGEKRVREMEEYQREQAEKTRLQQAQHQKVVAKAKEIYERFKEGKKITSEELLVLQQSGLF
ncbi:MAG: hypothetical protein V1717_00375 [Candidatus Micrarchaeota archaeon]